jgi:hypothetical protein
VSWTLLCRQLQRQRMRYSAWRKGHGLRALRTARWRTEMRAEMRAERRAGTRAETRADERADERAQMRAEKRAGDRVNVANIYVIS